MILGDRLVALETERVGCRTCAFLAGLDDAAERDRLAGIIAQPVGDGRVSTRRIAQALAGLPGAPTRNSIDAHRAGHAS